MVLFVFFKSKSKRERESTWNGEEIDMLGFGVFGYGGDMEPAKEDWL
jgi:hypothetical protein